MNKALFRSVLKSNGATQGDLAKEIGITEQTFSEKLNERKGRDFNLGEVVKLKKLLGITNDELIDIFFDD